MLSPSLVGQRPAMRLVIAATCMLSPLPSSARAQCNPSFDTQTTFATGSGPNAIAVGDIDLDGRADVFTANFSAATVSVLRGNCGQSFNAAGTIGVGAGPTAIALADLRKVGLLDMVVACRTAGDVRLMVNSGNGADLYSQRLVTPSAPYGLASGDFDGDGRLDIAVTLTGGGVSILKSLSDGRLQLMATYPAGSFSRSVVATDLNNDGKLDLVVANTNSNNLSVLIGAGDGTFSLAVNYPTGPSPTTVVSGDFNADGATDVAVCNAGGNSVSIFLGTGLGTLSPPFSYSASTTPNALMSTDINGDGKLDLIATGYNSGNLTVLLGNGFGGFSFFGTIDVGTNPDSLGVVDVNNDGRPDIVVTNDSDSTLGLIRNVTVNAAVFVAQHPASVLIQPGATANFSVVAAGPTGQYSYQWRRNGVNLTSGGRISGTTAPLLRISAVVPADAAQYDVLVTNLTACTPQITSRSAVLAVSAPPVLANDDCINATRIGSGIYYPVSTTGAITDGPQEPFLGLCCGNASISSDVWYRVTAGLTGTGQVYIESPSFNARVAIYRAICPGSPGTALAGGEYVPGSTFNFPVRAGEEYLVRIGGRPGAQGSASFFFGSVPGINCVADVAGLGGTPYPDGLNTVDDLIYFLNAFFNPCP